MVAVEGGAAYSGTPANYGQANDGMVGGRIGGVNVFGGGLALSGPGQVLLSGISCTTSSSRAGMSPVSVKCLA